MSGDGQTGRRNTMQSGIVPPSGIVPLLHMQLPTEALSRKAREGVVFAAKYGDVDVSKIRDRLLSGGEGVWDPQVADDMKPGHSLSLSAYCFLVSWCFPRKSGISELPLS